MRNDEFTYSKNHTRSTSTHELINFQLCGFLEHFLRVCVCSFVELHLPVSQFPLPIKMMKLKGM